MRKYLVAVCMVVFLLGGYSVNAKEDVVKIGGLAPLTGPVAMYGVTSMNGAKLAIEEINNAGGILGKKVEFNVVDEVGDPIQAVNAYNRLLDWDMNVLIGSITSKPTLAVAERSVGDGVPMITPTGTQLKITEGKPNVFRLCFTDPYQGKVLAKFAKEELKAKTAAILVNTSSDYSGGIADAFIEEAKKEGIEILLVEGFSDNDKDFKVQLTKILPKKPDVILMPEYYEKSSLMAIQARELGIESIILGGDGWDGIVQATDKSSYDALENSYFANHYSDKDTSEKIVNFVASYEKKYKEKPTAFSALSYDCVYILKNAIEKAGSLDNDKINEAMRSIDFKGMTGDLKFDENNNPIKSVTIIKINNGEYNINSVVNY